MLKILWLLLVVALLSLGAGWLFDDNGTVLINWLGYEVAMDVLTAIFLSFLVAITVFSVAYLLARVISWKFPNFFKVLFKKHHMKRLELIVKRQGQAFDELEKILTFIDVGDVKDAKKGRRKFGNLVKNKKINEYLDRKLGLFEDKKKGWWRFW